MRKAIVALIAALALGAAAAPALAQNGTSSSTQVNVNRLPLNLQRIQRALQESSSTEGRDGLRIRYQVDVYGRAPAIELFTKDDDLVNGPVPYGAPTHRQMLEMMTPQEFRAPAADLTTVFRWLADKAKKQQ